MTNIYAKLFLAPQSTNLPITAEKGNLDTKIYERAFQEINASIHDASTTASDITYLIIPSNNICGLDANIMYTTIYRENSNSFKVVCENKSLDENITAAYAALNDKNERIGILAKKDLLPQFANYLTQKRHNLLTYIKATLE